VTRALPLPPAVAGGPPSALVAPYVRKVVQLAGDADDPATLRRHANLSTDDDRGGPKRTPCCAGAG
jgi:hypothetical protein